MADEELVDDIEWTPYADLHLINSLAGLKPIGPGYHFCMTAIWHKFNAAMGINIKMSALKKRIATWYDIEAAERLVGESPPQIPFSLPVDEFPDVLKKENLKKETPATKHTPKTSKAESKSERVKTSRVSDEEKKTPATKKRNRGSEKAPPSAKRGRH